MASEAAAAEKREDGRTEIERALSALAEANGSIHFRKSWDAADERGLPRKEVCVIYKGDSAHHVLGWNEHGAQPSEVIVHLVGKLGGLDSPGGDSPSPPAEEGEGREEKIKEAAEKAAAAVFTFDGEKAAHLSPKGEGWVSPPARMNR